MEHLVQPRILAIRIESIRAAGTNDRVMAMAPAAGLAAALARGHDPAVSLQARVRPLRCRSLALYSPF